jgi:Flp pilus assembly pilin Flp
MKIAWTILLVSAMTDFVITVGTALSSAMLATGDAALPSISVIALAVIGGVVAAARTVQQALKAAYPDSTTLFNSRK